MVSEDSELLAAMKSPIATITVHSDGESGEPLKSTL
jgi:hypothetical protein